MDGAEPLSGMLTIALVGGSGGFVANTMTEVHRTNSSYLLYGKDTAFMAVLRCRP